MPYELGHNGHFTMAPKELTIHQLRVFDTVTQAGSLSGAASALDLPQPSISRLIARIERELGSTLLERSSTGVSLTPAGERFLKHARLATYHHDLAIEEAQAAGGLLQGEVRVAAPDSVGAILFAPFVRKLKKRHPELRLRTIASQSTAVPAMLATETIDIGVVADTHAPPGGAREVLFQEHLYLIGPKRARVLKNKSVRLADTAQLPLVINAMPGGFRKLIDRAFAEVGIDLKVQVEMDANGPLLELLLDGEGFSILPYSVLEAASLKRSLGASLLIDPMMSRTLSAVVAPGKPQTTAIREVIRAMREVVREQAERARWLLLD